MQEVAQYAKEHENDFSLWLFEGTDSLTFDVRLACLAFREAYKMLPTPLQLEATRSLLLAVGVVKEPAIVIDFLRSPKFQRIFLESPDDVLNGLTEKGFARVYFSHPELNLGVPLRTSRERLVPILEGIYNAALQRETQSEDLNSIILNEKDTVLAFQGMRKPCTRRRHQNDSTPRFPV
ncbi:hypothetical protein D6792_00395 [Candidatus Parcubacteria bacterium]|nr:MAG: hypothetical protein D6792_00395 [Candidatus Parcubacteria bacterium]